MKNFNPKAIRQRAKKIIILLFTEDVLKGYLIIELKGYRTYNYIYHGFYLIR